MTDCCGYDNNCICGSCCDRDGIEQSEREPSMTEKQQRGYDQARKDQAMTDDNRDPCEVAWREHLADPATGFSEGHDYAFRAGYAAATERAAVECEDVANVESERTIGIPTTGLYQIGCRNCATAIRGR